MAVHEPLNGLPTLEDGRQFPYEIRERGHQKSKPEQKGKDSPSLRAAKKLPEKPFRVQDRAQSDERLFGLLVAYENAPPSLEAP